MTPSAVRIAFDSPTGQFQPGDRLSGRFLVEDPPFRAARAVELSVLWYTAGKGEEDLSVHHFERLTDEPARPLDLRVPRKFATSLPPSPLSYDGVIVKVCWCIRVRIFWPHGQEVVSEIPFRLGQVPPAVIEQPVTETPPLAV